MNKELLKEKLNKYSIPFSDESADKLVSFNDMMLEYNKSHNLTSITDEEGVLFKHFIDSLAPIDIFKENTQIIDIGCGGGFPSVPLAIINKNLNILAVDSVNKKTEFVKMVKNTLNLPNLSVKNARIEDLAQDANYREQFDTVISRAVASLNTIIEYSAPLLKVGGKIVAYKGSNYKEELTNAKNALNILKCSIKEVKEYYLDEIDANRVVIIIEKQEKTPNKYPRKQNKPRLNPL